MFELILLLFHVHAPMYESNANTLCISKMEMKLSNQHTSIKINIENKKNNLHRQC